MVVAQKSDTFALFQVVAGALLTVVEIGILLLHIKKCSEFLRSGPSKSGGMKGSEQFAFYRKLSHILTVFTLFLYAAHGLYFTLESIGLFGCVWSKAVSALLYHTSKVSLYFVLSTRLMVGFAESTYKNMITKISYFIYIAATLFELTAMWGDLTFVTGHKVVSQPKLHITWCILNDWPIGGVIFFFLFDTTISLIALMAFMYPLRQIIIMTQKLNDNTSTNGSSQVQRVGSVDSVDGTDTTSNNSNNENNSNSGNFSAKNTKHNAKHNAKNNAKNAKNAKTSSLEHSDARILNLLQRYTFLTFTALFGTFIFVILINYLKLSFLLLLDNVVNGLCIILMSSFYNDWYNVLCCCSKWKICSCGLVLSKSMNISFPRQMTIGSSRDNNDIASNNDIGTPKTRSVDEPTEKSKTNTNTKSLDKAPKTLNLVASKVPNKLQITVPDRSPAGSPQGTPLPDGFDTPRSDHELEISQNSHPPTDNEN